VGGLGYNLVNAINDAGQSVGTSDKASDGFDAVLWSRSGKARVLQNLAGYDMSVPEAINDAGWSVGHSSTDVSSSNEAVLWSPSRKATDLGAVLGPAWTDTEAVGINNSGDIVGWGIYRREARGFLLTPDSALFAVPEPSTWAMMLVGFASLGFAGYRRTKKGRDTLAA
jgi:hypothetical protein